MHLKGQMIRSSSSAALNYGEHQDAESIKDSIHKLGVVLKELKETRVALKFWPISIMEILKNENIC